VTILYFNSFEIECEQDVESNMIPERSSSLVFYVNGRKVLICFLINHC